VGDDIHRLRSEVPADMVTEFDLGSTLGCGLRLDGTPVCWGSPFNGSGPPQVPMHLRCWGETLK
jgi:hypothetical protein